MATMRNFEALPHKLKVFCLSKLSNKLPKIEYNDDGGDDDDDDDDNRYTLHIYIHTPRITHIFIIYNSN
jgi:hypothetical protein